MGHKFAEIAFTPNVKKEQEENGSRSSYERMEGGAVRNDHLGANEVSFVAARDSLYMATVSETGWPYIQHRGGAPGFLRVLDDRTIGFADFRGNRQYVTIGNLANDDRVSLILLDYPNRARLKILGRAEIIAKDNSEMLQRLSVPDYGAHIERGIVIRVDAFDWNCPQHITPRYTLTEIEEMAAPLRERIAALESKLKSCECKEP